MTAPLDEKGLIAAAKALINADPTMHGHHQSHIEAKMPYASVSVAAYLAASPSPSEMEALKTLNADLLMQAKGHAQEARTANSTIYEIYQVLSGAKGEPGNWNGAEPARRYVEAAEARIKALEEALRPFANEADQWEEFEDSEALVEGWNGGPASSVNVGSLRSARTALKENAQ